jgi:hypothetical protein
MTSTPPTRLLATAAVVLALIGGCSAPSETIVPSQAGAGRSTPPAATAVASALGDRPEVPRIDACKLLTDDEVEAGLGLLDIEWVDRIFITQGGGEACTWTFVGTDNVQPAGQVLQIGPGEPADFEQGAMLDGRAGSAVSLAKGAAVWFPASNGGVLSVGERNDLGYLFYRIGVTRPDIDDAARLAVATEMAVAALPRFPGMSGTGSEPEVVTFDRKPPDTSNLSYADNLLAREQAGDWSLGEGLVATLKFFTGEADAAGVLNDPDILDPSSADVIAMARQYVVDGPDANARDEVAALLDRLIFTHQELEEMGAGAQPTVLPARLAGPRTGSPRRFADPCTDIGKTIPCVRPYEPALLTDLNKQWPNTTYEMDVMVTAVDAWGGPKLYAAAEALRDAANRFEALGSMPATVDLLATPFDTNQSVVWSEAGQCSINLNRPLLQMADAQMKQWIAADLADCFITATFPTQAAGSSTSKSWWRRALALYLSNVVYNAPQCDFGKGLQRCDLEWAFADTFASQELTTNLVQRTEANWLFFQHLEKTEDVGGILNLIRRLPAGDATAPQVLALIGYEPMAGLFHDFGKSVSDNAVRDTGGGSLQYAYTPAKDDLMLTCSTEDDERPGPFETVRLQLSVSGGKSAKLAYTRSGDIQVSWRPGTAGANGVTGGWSDELPEYLSDDAVMVITTTEPGASFDLRVTDLSPSCNPTPRPSTSICSFCGFSNFFQFADAVSDYVQRVVNGG